jgi:hypothetical protein
MRKIERRILAVSGIFLILLGNSCSILPKQLIYPHEEKVPKQASQAGAVVGAPSKGGLKENEPGFADKIMKAKKIEMPGVESEGKWKNALTKTYPLPYGTVFDTVLESILYLPIETVDKSAGIITTGWKRDTDLTKEALVAINVFGDGVRLVRYKYSVRVYDRGEKTKITVIPFAQVTKNRRWIDGNPSVAITEKLMQKIIQEMER